MDFTPSEAQQAIQELCRDILSDLVTDPSLVALEEDGGGMHGEAWEQLGASELLSVALPEAAGGAGVDWLAIGSLLVEVGRAVAPIPALDTLAVAGPLIGALASESQQAAMLEGVGAGAVIAVAAEEPGSRDPRHPTSRLVFEGQGLRLDGEKTAVAFAAQATRFVVPAVLDGRVRLAVVPAAASGVQLEAQQGTNGIPMGRVRFEGVRLEADDLLVDDPDAASLLVDCMRLGQVAVLTGVAERALELSAEYCRTRKQFGQPIGTFQAVSQRLADAYIHVESMRATLWQAAWRMGEGRSARREIGIARYIAAEGAHFVVCAAQHVHGGMGFDRDYPLHRYFLWCKQHEFALGGSQAMLAELGARD